MHFPIYRFLKSCINLKITTLSKAKQINHHRMKHQFFIQAQSNVKNGLRLLFVCCLSFFIFSNSVFAKPPCPNDLNIVFTGDSDNDVCQNGNNLVLSLSGNHLPNNPNNIIWYGGLSEGTAPGEVADYGLTGIFMQNMPNQGLTRFVLTWKNQAVQR